MADPGFRTTCVDKTMPSRSLLLLSIGAVDGMTTSPRTALTALRNCKQMSPISSPFRDERGQQGSKRTRCVLVNESWYNFCDGLDCSKGDEEGNDKKRTFSLSCFAATNAHHLHCSRVMFPAGRANLRSQARSYIVR